jgi:hypothetical protein
MKDILEWIATHLTSYFRDVGTLVCRPKTFLAERTRSPDQGFSAAVTFLGVSGALGVISTAPLLRGDLDLWEYLVARLIQLGLGVALLAVCLRGCWWLVGGRAPTLAFFEICAYLGGIAILLLVLFDLLAEGTLRLGDPQLLRSLEGAKDRSDLRILLEKPVGRIYLSLFGAGLVAVVGWVVAGWGAFRQISKVGRTRSAVAFTLVTPLALVVIVVVFTLGMALSRLEF